jgi:hypothetical protein
MNALHAQEEAMKMIMSVLVAVLSFGGFTFSSFAEEMGKMKNDMSAEGMGHKDAMKGEMKGKPDDMKKQKDSMKGETKAKHDDMKGEMKTKHDDMKGEMKGAMGK